MGVQGQQVSVPTPEQSMIVGATKRCQPRPRRSLYVRIGSVYLRHREASVLVFDDNTFVPSYHAAVAAVSLHPFASASQDSSRTRQLLLFTGVSLRGRVFAASWLWGMRR